jgi:hypothetical protein
LKEKIIINLKVMSKRMKERMSLIHHLEDSNLKMSLLLKRKARGEATWICFKL